eukprot:scaffold349_cov267-Chaetoceros_neogracile.AAC.35
MLLIYIVTLLALISESLAGVPSEPLFFTNQIIDHLSQDDSSTSSKWTQRYYASGTHFAGPGQPIFVIMGGEGAIEPSTGLYYPLIVNHLAKYFGAYVLQPEHRFYGASQPLEDLQFTPEHANTTTRLMTTEQALWDAVRLVRHTQSSLGCTLDRDSATYCPVITVGGSYPGFLSAMMRIRHPDVVDMAYSASAPMQFYAQRVNQTSYYDHITKVAEKSSQGCSAAVRSTLVDAMGPLFREIKTRNDVDELADMLGICPGTLPMYITDTNGVSMDSIRKTFYDELMMVVGYTFANYNMANYPPDSTTTLYKACQIFQNTEIEPTDRLAQFLLGVDSSSKQSCFNMKLQLPNGPNGTITAGDWSGVGAGRNGQMWDFQTCTLLIEHIGFGEESMFPVRPWTMEWMNQHCQTRFGAQPDPFRLVKEWRFDDMENAGVTHILFTNGLNDGWSVGGLQKNISETLLALNFENGAHHSDLSAVGPSVRDTDDIRDGFVQIRNILEDWLTTVSRGGISNDTHQSQLRKGKDWLAVSR